MNATPTLYEWAGGEAAIGRLMECFYDRVERDERLSPYFPGGVSEEHRAHVSIWWSEVLGGPARYTEDLGGYEKMLAHHRGLAIAPEERHRFVSLLSSAADDAGLPDDPEFRSALVAYAEWGSRLAMHNSQPGAGVARARARTSLGLGRGAPISALGRPSRSCLAPPSGRPPRACRGDRQGALTAGLPGALVFSARESRRRGGSGGPSLADERAGRPLRFARLPLSRPRGPRRPLSARTGPPLVVASYV